MKRGDPSARRGFGPRAAATIARRWLAGPGATPGGRLRLGIGLASGAALVVAGVELERHLHALESWTASLGPTGMAMLLALYVAGTSLLLPDTVFRLAAGALLGVWPGVAGVVLGTLIGSSLQFALARPLRPRIGRFVDARPALSALRDAVLRNDGVRLQLLVRVTPINHASVSYLLGAAGVRLRPFLIALSGMLPQIVLEVWAGHVGRGAAGLDGPHDAGDLAAVGALVAGIAAMVLVSRAAHAALTRASIASANHERRDDGD